MLYALKRGCSYGGAGGFLPARVSAYDFRAVFLFCACLVYALFGSPTPDSFGWPEGLLIVLVGLAIGAARIRDLLGQSVGPRFWKSTGQALLVYGLSVPLVAGALGGNGAGAILRDLAPFLCLFLPLFFLPVIRARPQYFRTTLLGILLIGLLFSLRSLVMRFGVACGIDVWCANDELLYLENMPTVLFTCLFLLGSAVSVAARGVSVRCVAVFSALAALALLPLAAMILTVQRASIGALAVYLVCIYVYVLYKAPGRAVFALILGGLALYAVGISLEGVAEPLAEKTRAVGLNMRLQEMAAVWDVVSADPLSLLFGTGWGRHFNSPAVGGLAVNFTHNFFSSMLLKTGLVGVLLCAAYIAGLLERLWRVIRKNPVFGLAIAAPIAIDLSLYASFKSLDFGLALLMIPASLVYFRQVEKSHIA